jgi:hypothetical protein
MFETGNGLYKNFLPQFDQYLENIHPRRYNQALNQFKWTVYKGRCTRLVKKVLGDRQWLYDLSRQCQISWANEVHNVCSIIWKALLMKLSAVESKNK